MVPPERTETSVLQDHLDLPDHLEREESRELVELLDSRVFPDPRVPLVRVESPESRV